MTAELYSLEDVLKHNLFAGGKIVLMKGLSGVRANAWHTLTLTLTVRPETGACSF